MRRFFLTAALISIVSAAGAQNLRFDETGNFKIVQFTDLHYIVGNPDADAAKECLENVIRAEAPDLVLLTGDIIFGKPAEECLKAMLNTVSGFGVPFGIMFGNHDDEQGLTRKELYNIACGIPHNVTSTEEGISGIANYVLKIKASGSEEIKAAIYCFDSNSYSGIEGVGGYDYIKHDQIEWYRRTGNELAVVSGSPVPSYAFFHIPLPEYNDAAQDESSVMIGTRGEKACSPELNSGLFTAMKEQGDIKAVFAGHDHNNDYAVYWKGIMLAYGRYSGGNTVYNNLPNGGRVIVLKEDGKSFRTWIRQRDGSILNEIEFPYSFFR